MAPGSRLLGGTALTPEAVKDAEVTELDRAKDKC